MKSFKKLATITLLLSIPAMSSAYYYNNSSNNGSQHYSVSHDLHVTARAIFLEPIKIIDFAYSHPSIYTTYRCITNPAIVACAAGIYYLYSKFQQKPTDAKTEEQAPSDEQNQQ